MKYIIHLQVTKAVYHLQSIDLSKLTDEERWRLEHQRLHEKHRGHEAMHAEMVLILIVTLIVAQVLLVQWKQRHFRSYQVNNMFLSILFEGFTTLLDKNSPFKIASKSRDL